MFSGQGLLMSMLSLAAFSVAQTPTPPMGSPTPGAPPGAEATNEAAAGFWFNGNTVGTNFNYQQSVTGLSTTGCVDITGFLAEDKATSIIAYQLAFADPGVCVNAFSDDNCQDLLFQLNGVYPQNVPGGSSTTGSLDFYSC